MRLRCAVCGSEVREIFKLHGIPINACLACGHRQCGLEPDEMHLQAQYGDAYFNGGGAGYHDYLSHADLLLDHGRRYAEILRPRCESGSLLDIGCAAGFISRAFIESGWIATGIEPNAAMAEHARNHGVAAHVGGIETIDSNADFMVPAGGFDLILMIQVVAHFFDLDSALSRVNNLARRGGYCLVETWDSASMTARVLGRHWHEYSPPSVLHYFSRESMDRLMSRHGFEKVASARPLKRLRLDHAISLMRYKYGRNAAGAFVLDLVSRLPGRLSLPYPSEDLFWALYRKVGEPADSSGTAGAR